MLLSINKEMHQLDVSDLPYVTDGKKDRNTGILCQELEPAAERRPSA
jgi:hypothetical protein